MSISLTIICLSSIALMQLTVYKADKLSKTDENYDSLKLNKLSAALHSIGVLV